MVLITKLKNKQKITLTETKKLTSKQSKKYASLVLTCCAAIH